MKKVVKIIAGVIVGIFILLLVLPILFKGKVENIVKEQVDKQVDAKVNYDHFSLSLIKSFPDINIGVEGLSVVGTGVFENDTLLYLGEFSTEADLFSAFSGEIEIESVFIGDLLLNAKVLPDSTANWDIMKSSEEVVEQEESGETSDFRVSLNSFVIKDANIRYVDETMNLQSSLNGFQVNLSGDMSQSKTNLQVQSKIEEIFVVYDEVKYINGTSVALDAGLAADLDNMSFAFLDNELLINSLSLYIDGDVIMKEEGYGLDLTMGSSKTDFKSLLSLIPEVYLKDYEDLETSGKLQFNATVNGDYIDEDHLPAFNVLLTVDKGMFKYPDLPESIDNIGIVFKMNNPGGSADSTLAVLEKFHFELANNPFDASLHISSPVSNLTFAGKVDGSVDLGSLLDAVPVDSVEIKGLITADLAINGDYATVEKEDYENIKAKGTMALTDFEYQSEDIPQGLLINNSKMSFSPKAVELESFDCKVGESDFQLTGILQNYLSYVLKDGVLKGKLTHYSKYINSNEFLTVPDESEEVEDSIVSEMAVIEVPKNIDFVLNSKVEHVLYDKLNINNINGKVTIKNGIVSMDALKMNLLKGGLVMNGQYNTANMNKPFVDFGLEGSNLDLNMAANSFSVVDSMLPLAKNAAGKVSPKLTYYSLLGNDAMPIMSSVDGGGRLVSKSVVVSGTKMQNSLAATLKNDKYKVMKTEDLNIYFTIDKGNIIVKPFKTKVGGQVVEVQGTQGVDQSVNYKITMPVPRKEVVEVGGLMGFNLPTSGDDLIVDIMVTGTVQDPVLAFDLGKAQKQVGKELEKEAGKVIKQLMEDPETQKKVEDLTKKFKDIFK